MAKLWFIFDHRDRKFKRHVINRSIEGSWTVVFARAGPNGARGVSGILPPKAVRCGRSVRTEITKGAPVRDFGPLGPNQQEAYQESNPKRLFDAEFSKTGA